MGANGLGAGRVVGVSHGRRIDANRSNLAGTLFKWLRVSEERRLLNDLDDRMLRDIGVERGDAEQEARRPFWDLPHRR